MYVNNQASARVIESRPRSQKPRSFIVMLGYTKNIYNNNKKKNSRIFFTVVMLLSIVTRKSYNSSRSVSVVEYLKV